MKSFTKAQKGSPSRDRFKYLHKQMLPKEAYALDVDLELVEKRPFPFVVARLDFKMPGDTLTFTEALSYQHYLDVPAPHNVPIYIVEANPVFKSEESLPDEHRFTVYRLLEADYKPFPPTFKMKPIAKDLTWKGLSEWEMGLRRKRAEEMRHWLKAAMNK